MNITHTLHSTHVLLTARVIISVSLSILSAQGQAAIYKSVENGKVVYSDTATSSNAKKITPSLPAGVSVISPERYEDAKKHFEERDVAFKAADDTKSKAEEKLRVAERMKAAGEEPLPGERQRLANGNSKLNDKYWDRQKKLEETVAKARQEAEKARAEFQVFR